MKRERRARKIVLDRMLESERKCVCEREGEREREENWV